MSDAPQDDDFVPAPEFFARSALLATLNAIEDAFAAQYRPEAVFAIMQAKEDLGLPVSR